MILVFGGTTEGRKAVEVLEESGSPYYYSTKTGEQDLTLHHGQRIDGALDAEAMLPVWNGLTAMNRCHMISKRCWQRLGCRASAN